ncbi:heme ABC transporter ATP-binding protein [Thalassolituus sp. LLYu03]|uniref:heme ABC transporter ATP-binding protein n=1 Tax=Thalassolituus sp. LLYu03 TaxID=3421656 RepID=UPI003D2E33B6
MGHKTLLDNVSLTLKPGERLAVLGPNGAGKSTLLDCLSGSRVASQGDVLLQNRPLNHWVAGQRARRLAVMQQTVQLSFPLRVWQVVAMGRSPHGDDQQTQGAQREAMQLAGVWHLRQRQYPGLSGGEQQRVQLARVLVQIWEARHSGQGYYLLLDECTSALDPAHQHGVMAVIRDFARQGTATLAVMHDIALAASWADRVLMLKNGRVCALGPVDLLLDQTCLAETYELPPALAARYARQCQQWACV